MARKSPEQLGVDRASTDLTDFSPSRLTTAGKCGLAFEYQYVRHIPAPYDTGASMFGDAIHDGTEEWYDAEKHDYTKEDLAPIVLAQWERLLPPRVWSDVLELRKLDEECSAVAAAVLFQRPNLKSPATTKQYLETKVVQEFHTKKQKMVERCDALEEVKWPKDEDPYVAYRKSAAIAAKMQARWQSKPRPVAVEFPFAIELFGFRVRGRIDLVRLDPLANGLVIPRGIDIKTGRQVMTQMEAFLQAYVYNEACEWAADAGLLPRIDGHFAFYLARSDKYQQGRVDRERHGRLASRIFNGRARQIAMGQFEPSYGFWCKQCDFKDLCSTEISLWQGDGLVAELMEAP